MEVLNLDYLKTYSFVKQIWQKIMYKIKILAFFENTVNKNTVFFKHHAKITGFWLYLSFFMQKPCTVKKF